MRAPLATIAILPIVALLSHTGSAGASYDAAQLADARTKVMFHARDRP